MKIKSICWLYEILYGGVESRAEHLADYLSIKQNVEFVYAQTIGGIFAKHGDGHRFRHKKINIFFNPYKVYYKRFWEEYFIRRATEYIKSRRNDTDIVDGQGINAIPGIRANIPTITTVHGVDRWIENPPQLEKLLLEKATKIITITKRVRSQLIEKGVEPQKISVIYNGVNFHEIDKTKVESKDFMKKYGVYPQKKIILSVHNFIPLKNTKGIIQSFTSIQKKHEDYQLVLIGDGPDRQYYVDYAKKEKIRDICFTGKLFGEELFQFYKSADIFILPSLKESFPVSCLEAMAAKCAVILTRNSDVVEVAEDKEHCIYVSPHNQVDINRALTALIEDSDLRERVRTNGYNLAKTKSWEKQGELLWEEIKQLK
jgi:glycosyltransferase involved in cell wall biosynthesis